MILQRRQNIKQPRLLSPVLLSFMTIVLVVVSHLSVAATSWSGFDSLESVQYNSVHHWGDNFTVQMLDLDEFNNFQVLRKNDSVQLHWNPDEIHGQNLFPNIHTNENLSVMSDELLTLQINSQVSEWENDMQPTTEPTDNTIFKNDTDNIDSLRIPAPTSLLLVAIGLLSLRYTRSLRL